MTELLVDDFQTTLAPPGSPTTSSTSLTLVDATGLPSPTGGDFVRLRVEPVPANGTHEFMLMTGLSGTTATVTRAQESTSGVAWAAGSKVSAVVTALTLAKLPVSTQTIPNAGISGAAETLLHDCEALSNAFGTWSANNRFVSGTTLGTSTTKFTTGAKSVLGVINTSTTTNPNMTSRFWCDLAANVSVAPTDTLAFDVGWEDINGTLYWDPWGETVEFWIADGVGLTGNVVKSVVPADGGSVGTTAPMSTVTLGFGGLTSIRSFGFVIVKNTDAATDARLEIWVDHVRVKEQSDVEVALASSSIGGVIARSETGGLSGFPSRRRTGKTMWDQRNAGGFWSEQFGTHIRELAPNIDATGSTDMTDTLNAAIRQLQPGDHLYCDPDSVFRVDDTVNVINLDRVVMDWRGSRFFSSVDHTDAGAMWVFGEGYNIRMRDFQTFGFTSATANGSAMELSAGAPVVSGTTYTLPALGDAVRDARKSTGDMVFYSRDVNGYYKIDLTLSASVSAANDCMVTLVDENGVEQYRTVLTLTTTPTVYPIKFEPKELDTRVEWIVTKNTSAVSTITVTSLTQYGRTGYDATKANWSGLQTARGISGLILEDFHTENFGGDGITCATQANRMTWRNFTSRTNRRQGISLNGDKDGVYRTHIHDFEIIAPARHGIDLEPETNGANIVDVRIHDGIIYGAELGGFVAQGWARITDMHISDIAEYPGSAPATNFDGGAVGGTISRYFVDSTAVETAGSTAQISPKFIVRGQNMMVHDIVCDHGFEFSPATSTTSAGTFTPSGNYATGIRVRRAGNHATALNRAAKSRIDNVTTIGPDEGFAPGKGGTVGLAAGPVEVTAGGSFSNLDLAVHRNQFPDTYKGIAHSSLWVPLGMNVGAEPILGVRGMSSRGASITVKSSATVTTTTSGPAVTVTPYSTLRLMLDITAASGTTAPTLDVVIEASHDGVTWRPVGSFTQHTIACRETIDFFVGAETQIRATANVGGSSPSFTYSVTGRQHIPATHLAGNLAVSTSATTGTVVFPSSTVPVNPSSVALAQGGTGGTLTLLGTYFYRVAGRLRPGGPLVPLAQQSITLTGTNNSVKITPTFGLGSFSTAPEGITVYRGTSSGVYDTRFDWLPNARMWGTRGAQLLTDKGETLAFVAEAELTSGYPATTCRQAGSFTPVDETGWEVDALYKVVITPSWATTVGVTTKRRDGFDLAFGTPAPAGATVDWLLVR